MQSPQGGDLPKLPIPWLASPSAGGGALSADAQHRIPAARVGASVLANMRGSARDFGTTPVYTASQLTKSPHSTDADRLFRALAGETHSGQPTVSPRNIPRSNPSTPVSHGIGVRHPGKPSVPAQASSTLGSDTRRASTSVPGLDIHPPGVSPRRHTNQADEIGRRRGSLGDAGGPGPSQGAARGGASERAPRRNSFDHVRGGATDGAPRRNSLDHVPGGIYSSRPSPPAGSAPPVVSPRSLSTETRGEASQQTGGAPPARHVEVSSRFPQPPPEAAPATARDGTGGSNSARPTQDGSSDEDVSPGPYRSGSGHPGSFGSTTPSSSLSSSPLSSDGEGDAKGRVGGNVGTKPKSSSKHKLTEFLSSPHAHPARPAMPSRAATGAQAPGGGAAAATKVGGKRDDHEGGVVVLSASTKADGAPARVEASLSTAWAEVKGRYNFSKRGVKGQAIADVARDAFAEAQVQQRMKLPLEQKASLEAMEAMVQALHDEARLMVDNARMVSGSTPPTLGKEEMRALLSWMTDLEQREAGLKTDKQGIRNRVGPLSSSYVQAVLSFCMKVVVTASSFSSPVFAMVIPRMFLFVMGMLTQLSGIGKELCNELHATVEELISEREFTLHRFKEKEDRLLRRIAALEKTEANLESLLKKNMQERRAASEEAGKEANQEIAYLEDEIARLAQENATLKMEMAHLMDTEAGAVYESINTGVAMDVLINDMEKEHQERGQLLTQYQRVNKILDRPPHRHAAVQVCEECLCGMCGDPRPQAGRISAERVSKAKRAELKEALSAKEGSPRDHRLRKSGFWELCMPKVMRAFIDDHLQEDMRADQLGEAMLASLMDTLVSGKHEDDVRRMCRNEPSVTFAEYVINYFCKVSEGNRPEAAQKLLSMVSSLAGKFEGRPKMEVFSAMLGAGRPEMEPAGVDICVRLKSFFKEKKAEEGVVWGDDGSCAIAMASAERLMQEFATRGLVTRAACEAVLASMPEKPPAVPVTMERQVHVARHAYGM
eukprot:jgi/Mesvir1/9687/Mv12167-RA.2